LSLGYQEIEDHDVRPPSVQLLQRRQTVFSDDDLVAFDLEVDPEAVRETGVVFYDEDAWHGHTIGEWSNGEYFG
jgi:hypothetical protein